MGFQVALKSKWLVKQGDLMTGDPGMLKNIQCKRPVFISPVLPGQHLMEEK